MSPVEILLLAVGLAMDAFAVSLGAGAGPHAVGRRPVFRLSFHFGLFQFIMPVAGWFAGARVAGLVESVDHWITFGILAFVGGRMVAAGLGGGQEVGRADPSRGWTLVLLAVATSIDALAVGFSLALLKVSIWLPALVIGLVCALLSVAGMRLGRVLGAAVGKRMEVVGGLVLLAIGVRILVDHGVF
ncbi:MAG TPA: manganese efflux pump MntP family protein [Thermoanaerobaculaceae bacterium]|nr:manganese efflux pump MntP family protein [Thermoanaerobaculaceae bacterium]HRS15417.1 manganese efflux pump MntP family protein [Thermoanaerobaculaceae bacterium]